MKKKHCKEGRPGSNQMILIHSKVNKLFKKQGTNTLYCFANGHYQTVHPPSLTLIPALIPTHSHPPKIMPFHRIHVAIKLGRMGGDLGWKKLFKSSYVFSMLAFLVSLCARMFYMLAVLKYFYAYVFACFFDIDCRIFFAFEKLTSKNPYIEKFLFIQRSI